MCRICWNGCSGALLTGVIFCSFTAFALDLEPGVGAGLEYSDNAALSSDDEQSDWIAVGYVGASIEADSGPLQVRATTALNYQNYTGNTFSDKYYFNLGATAGWDMIKDRVDWQLQNYFTQRLVNSVDPDTPDNIRDTNVFTFGPTILFSPSGSQTLTLRPIYRNYYYEDLVFDNQQYALLANWFYQTHRLTNVGLDGGVTRAEYDDQRRVPNYTISQLHFVVSGKRARSEYSIQLGATNTNRDRVDDQTGVTGNLTWLVRLAGHSEARTYIASELRDSNSGLLNASVNPDNGDFSNEQISGDVLRNSIIRFEYNWRDATLNSRFWGELRDLDYQESPNDREVQAVGAELNYPVTALLSGGVYGRYNRTELTDISRTDKRYVVGGNISYQLSRKLHSVLDFRYRNRDSTQSDLEYSEMSVFASLVYGYGQVTRPSRTGGGF